MFAQVHSYTVRWVVHSTNHPQLKQSTHVTCVSQACNIKTTYVGHMCDMHTADTKTRVEILRACMQKSTRV